METTIQQTVSKITKWLDSKRIRYVLVGGLAASIRGRTRATDDVDLIVDCDADDALILKSQNRNHAD